MLSLYVPEWFWPASHVVALVIGCFLVRKDSDSPPTALAFITLFGPYFALAALPYVVVWLFFAAVCFVLGIKPAPDDGKGYADRY